MLSRFFNGTASPSSWFRDDNELKKLDELLTELIAKVNALRVESTQSGAIYIETKKYQIMSSLLTAVNQRIEQFKQIDGTPSNENKWLFVTDLMKIFHDTYRSDYHMLALQRNNRRVLAEKALTTGVEASTNGLSLAVALTYPLSGVVVGPLTYFYAAPWMSAKARKATGLDNQETASIRLIKRWLSALGALEERYDELDANHDVSSTAAAAANFSV